MSAPILKIDIQANASQLLSAINKGLDRIKELGSTIESLPTGDKQFNKLSRELARTQNTVKQLSDSLNKLGVESQQVAPKLEQVGNSSKSARTALTSLSLTIQDLPFGFLGVQNNLPGVIQGFGNLTATTNGKVLPALKEIGKSLLGPAGVFLGFSAVTSIITVATQKYGSLGEAFNALISGTKTLSKDQREYAANLAKEATDVLTLAALYKSFNGDRERQVEVIQKLNEVSPEYFGNLKAEKTNLDEVNKSLDKYINSFIGKIYIESQQKKINELFTKYAEQITKVVNKEVERKKNLKDTKQQVEGATKSNTEFYKSIIEGAKKVGTGDITVGIKLAPIKGTTEQQILQYKDELKKQFEGILGEIDIFKGFINLDDQFKTKGAKKIKDTVIDLKYEVDDLAKSFSLEEIISKASELAGVLLDQKATIKNGVIASKEYTNTFIERAAALKQLQQLAPDYFSSLNLEKTSYEDLDDLLFGYIRRLQNSRDEIIARANAAKLAAQADENTAKALDEQNKKFDQNIQKINEYNNVIANGTFNAYAKGIKGVEIYTKQLGDLQKRFEDTKNALQTIFFQPLSAAFEEFFNTGKFTFEEFGKTVLKNIKKIAAQLLATQIIQNLSQLLNPAGFIASGASNGLPSLLGRQQRGILGAFQGIGFGGVSAPNIGGISGGSLAMTGGVNLVLRGSDLVGSINRTNAQISRVG
jgi:hypothetical protein